MTPTDPQCHASQPQLAARLSVRVVELIQGDGLRYTCSTHRDADLPRGITKSGYSHDGQAQN
jgi:hypothetical protein